MEKYSITDYNEELEITINLPERLIQAMQIFDLFLDLLVQEKPEEMSRFIKALENRFTAFITEEFTDVFQVNSETFTGPLKEHIHLIKLGQQALLSFLQFQKYHGQKNITRLRVAFKDFLRCFHFFNFWLAQTLTTIMPRHEAIEFFKRFIDYRTPIIEAGNKYQNIELLYERTKHFLSTGTHNATLLKPHDGTMCVKTSRCMWHEIMEELKDPELVYVTICYGDFAAAKCYNEHFVLTRTQTLVQGKLYCDFCYHDKRIDKALTHPSKSFFDAL
ncbi:MAG: L-2-amino-thiazoline-4-carboxylic acid hydrolase [Promethearchaeota archaeon]